MLRTILVSLPHQMAYIHMNLSQYLTRAFSILNCECGIPFWYKSNKHVFDVAYSEALSRVICVRPINIDRFRLKYNFDVQLNESTGGVEQANPFWLFHKYNGLLHLIASPFHSNWITSLSTNSSLRCGSKFTYIVNGWLSVLTRLHYFNCVELLLNQKLTHVHKWCCGLYLHLKRSHIFWQFLKMDWV